MGILNISSGIILAAGLLAFSCVIAIKALSYVKTKIKEEKMNEAIDNFKNGSLGQARYAINCQYNEPAQPTRSFLSPFFSSDKREDDSAGIFDELELSISTGHNVSSPS